MGMHATDIVRLDQLMKLTAGAASVTVAVIDGPVDVSHPLIPAERVRVHGRHSRSICEPDRLNCVHGTGVAGILHRIRDEGGGGICPNCTLLICPMFPNVILPPSNKFRVPTARPFELAAALIDAVDAGAHVVNISAGLTGFPPALSEESKLTTALDYAVRHGTLVVVAGGNEAQVGSSALTRHPWVIPVVAVNLEGRPISQSNLGRSIGRNGVAAPGYAIHTLAPQGSTQTFSGSSAAAPFVTGTVALLKSLFPMADSSDMLAALRLTDGDTRNRRAIVPPLLNAWSAYERLRAIYGSG